jgi:hypothetical protein
MRCYPLVVLAALACASSVGSAQDSPIQLCVANMQLEDTHSSNPVGQAALMKYLAKEKSKSAVQYVPIDPAESEPALQTAKAKNCDYVVTTDQTESHVQSDIYGGANTVNPINMPVFYVAVTYKLTKVSDGSEVTSGNMKTSDRGSEKDAIIIAMHKIAPKLTDAIKKAGH